MNTHDLMPETIHADLYHLSYTCLLLPRHSSDPLNDKLAIFLEQSLQQICAACKWRNDFIEVHPDYFQWRLRVPPSTQISQFMKEIRHNTSASILLNFEEFRNTALSGDFWAPGYLVVSGARPYSKEMIAQYICLSRRHPLDL